jgi:hypothetical protein
MQLSESLELPTTPVVIAVRLTFNPHRLLTYRPIVVPRAQVCTFNTTEDNILMNIDEENH